MLKTSATVTSTAPNIAMGTCPDVCVALMTQLSGCKGPWHATCCVSELHRIVSVSQCRHGWLWRRRRVRRRLQRRWLREWLPAGRGGARVLTVASRGCTRANLAACPGRILRPEPFKHSPFCHFWDARPMALSGRASPVKQMHRKDANACLTAFLCHQGGGGYGGGASQGAGYGGGGYGGGGYGGGGYGGQQSAWD